MGMAGHFCFRWLQDQDWRRFNDYCKDQGHAENDDDLPVDDVMKTECDDEYNPDDFDFEVNDDSDDSDF